MAEPQAPETTQPVGGPPGGAPAEALPGVLTIVVKGMPSHFDQKQLRRAIVAEGITGLRKVGSGGKGAAQLKMETAEAATVALDILKGKKVVFKGRPLEFALVGSAGPPGSRNKRAHGDDEPPNKRARPTTAEEAVTPLSGVPYPEQLKQKHDSVRRIIEELPARLRSCGSKEMWVTKRGAFCPLADTMPSPVVDGYRNKCEFTIGRDAEGSVCVGFRLGCFRDGLTAVAAPDGCPNVSPEMKRVCAALAGAIKASSLPVYAQQGHVGFWRQALVRQNRKAEILISIQVRSSEVGSDSASAAVRAALEAAASVANVRSAHMQEWNGISVASADLPHTHLFGDEALVERIDDLHFNISPNSFFQVNTAAAEALGHLLLKLVSRHDGTKPTLVDVCCGAGMWGLCLAQEASDVIGIELSADAVDDARRNARANGVQNAKFLCGKAESHINAALAGVRGGVVAVVDPPRGGLHANVVCGLRACERLDHLIYVSCNPTTWLTDAERLCRPTSNKYMGAPFVPMEAFPVDLFPHTNHCELVVVFQRGKAAAASVADHAAEPPAPEPGAGPATD